MILIADSGSTKVKWYLTENKKKIYSIVTEGINPYFQSYDEIFLLINNFVHPKLKDYRIDVIYFFGAGCSTSENTEIVKKALANNFSETTIEIDSDLMGAAIGLCGNNAGIVAILGTGSNSCFYDGKKIVKQINPLGYILGDEGSGAVLGRLFLGACLKNQLNKGIKEQFLEEYQLTIPEILNKVYKQQTPNRFLAQFTYFIRKNIEDNSIYNIVFSNFTDFFRKNIMQLDYKTHTVYFTGSIAFHFQDVLKTVAEKLEIKVGKIDKSPINGLIKYY
jgi:N-acetylglucosamine kinase-like BadF-type ATPase